MEINAKGLTVIMNISGSDYESGGSNLPIAIGRAIGPFSSLY